MCRIDTKVSLSCRIVFDRVFVECWFAVTTVVLDESRMFVFRLGSHVCRFRFVFTVTTVVVDESRLFVFRLGSHLFDLRSFTFRLAVFDF